MDEWVGRRVEDGWMARLIDGSWMDGGWMIDG